MIPSASQKIEAYVLYVVLQPFINAVTLRLAGVARTAMNDTTQLKPH